MRTPKIYAPTDHAAGTLALTTAPAQPNYIPAAHTSSFHFYYQRSLGAVGAAISQTLAARCAADFASLVNIFGVTPGDLPFHVYVVEGVSGAMHYGCADTEIYVGTLPNLPSTADTYCLLLAAEVVEVFEAAINVGWNCGFSHGEGLSRVLATHLHPGAQTPDLITAPVWMDKPAPASGNRYNWVDNTDPSDTNPFSVGCAVLFLNWLHSKQGLQWDAISR